MFMNIFCELNYIKAHLKTPKCLWMPKLAVKNSHILIENRGQNIIGWRSSEFQKLGLEDVFSSDCLFTLFLIHNGIHVNFCLCKVNVVTVQFHPEGSLEILPKWSFKVCFQIGEVYLKYVPEYVKTYFF